MTNLDVEWAKDWMRRSSATLTEHRMELIDLDRAIGDGDHGENMARGFTAIPFNAWTKRRPKMWRGCSSWWPKP